MLELPTNYPQTLSELAECVYRQLNASMRPDLAGRLALDVTDAVQRHFAGSLLYIPRDAEGERERRNAAIRAEFDGGNQRALARRYGLALQTVYDILKDRKRKGKNRDDP